MSPGDLRRLIVTQSPVKDHQLTLVWKTCKEYNKVEVWLGGEGDSQGIVDDIELWSYYQMVHALTRIRLRKYSGILRSYNSGQKTRLNDN